ncbi:MAG TPA: isochorismatase family cysteine hydrolase [Burkholderiales bacterium]|nr:isochorismatase family cysteine hydrolase [Burkholderiales bacterium]
MPAATANLVRPRRRSRPCRVAAQPTPFVFDASRAALVVIDMQNDFLSAGGWFDSRGIDLAPVRAVIEPVNRVAAAARRAAIPVIWLNWANRPDRLNLPLGVLRTGAYGKRLPKGRILERGSWGARIVPELRVARGDIHVGKSRLSGFWDNELDSILRRMDASTLFFAGVNLDRCVLATMQDAAFIGYDAVLLDDCSASASPAYCSEAARFLLGLLYGFVATSDSLIAALKKGKSRVT